VWLNGIRANKALYLHGRVVYIQIELHVRANWWCTLGQSFVSAWTGGVCVDGFCRPWVILRSRDKTDRTLASDVEYGRPKGPFHPWTSVLTTLVVNLNLIPCLSKKFLVLTAFNSPRSTLILLIVPHLLKISASMNLQTPM
jgi:hypothetical protein